MAHDVFISHSAKDKVTATRCAPCWSPTESLLDRSRDVVPGMEWGECIIDAIEQSRIMVLVFRPTRIPRRRFAKKWSERQSWRRHPALRIEDVFRQALEYFIGNVHWLDA